MIENSQKRKDLELYLHIPFCVKKCFYCDFPSAPAPPSVRQAYVGELCRKIRSYAALARQYQVISIFVGGGTPSILSGEQTEAVFDALRETFQIAPEAEITIEMNPGTVTQEKLEAYQRIGINRLSIGLQSVDDRELAALGRIHTWRDFLDTYRMSRDTGFANINVDLISAIPGQTAQSWGHTLRTVAGLGPEHISAYSLMIEEGTLFYEIYGQGGFGEATFGDARSEPLRGDHSPYLPLPDEDEERLIYQNTKEILEEYGYYRYEISNYAKPGYECRHNLGYWSRTEYLGIGTGAASLMDNRRWVEGKSPEVLTKKDQMEEFVFLGLRKMKGISRTDFGRLFGQGIRQVYGAVIQDMEEKQLLEESGDFLRLTERGIDVSNYVMRAFLL